MKKTVEIVHATCIIYLKSDYANISLRTSKVYNTAVKFVLNVGGGVPEQVQSSCSL